MCVFSSPSPQSPPPTPDVPPVPELPDNGAANVSTDTHNLAVAALGNGGTIATGPQGLTTPAQTNSKILLGS